MSEEKSLIKSTDGNFFERVVYFFRRVFIKKYKVYSVGNNSTKSAQKNKLVNATEKDKYIENLQKCYESGILKDSDFTDEEKVSLAKLYEKQIVQLEGQIDGYERNLESYKVRILSVKNKLNLN